jgi:hypothetical protein
VQRLVEFRGAAARRVRRLAQARDAAGPRAAVLDAREAEVHPRAGMQQHVQARFARVFFVGEPTGLAQRRAQRVAETARQPRELAAVVAVAVFDHEVAEAQRAVA